MRWSELAAALNGRSQDTLTRRLREIDGGRDVFPYETADQLLRRIVKACAVRTDFFALNLAAEETAPEVPDSFQPDQDHQPDAQAEDEPGTG